MVNAADVAGQVAPAELEQVRTLLNSWLIPNDSRQPTDRFGVLARELRWRPGDAELVRELRDDLRHAVESGDAGCLNQWIARTRLRPVVEEGGIVYRHRAGPAGHYLAAVIAAIGAGTWKRLKACPDCKWVFYDNTRNASKRWCLMYAGGPDGRACGTIAKVRRYRDRQASRPVG
ncbi:MAG TPA: CGNR zinc finger domain-containing protein [Streptosporangiaceae bacterium]|nr:CGNR zinc finger domain-containing protein [Streptosporangiaceae bacterium]